MADPILTWLAQLAQLGAELPAAGPDLASAVEAELQRQIAQGTDPSGQPWPRTEAGTQPLRTVGKYLSVRAVPRAIVARLTGIGAMHHTGAVRGGRKRQILPDALTVPEPIASAVGETLDRRFAKITKGTSNG